MKAVALIFGGPVMLHVLIIFVYALYKQLSSIADASVEVS